MERPIETISEEVLLAWNGLSAKWQEETTWPTLEEATRAYGAAEQDHENATFLLQDLGLDIEDLERRLTRLSRDLPEDQKKIQANIILEQIARKQAEILSCENRIVLIEQRVLRHREIYHHLLTVHNRKIQMERFPGRVWPCRQSQCLGPPDEPEESEPDEWKEENVLTITEQDE